MSTTTLKPTEPLIGLTGPAGCGKTTIAEYLRSKHGFSIHNFSDPMKEMLNVISDVLEPRSYMEWSELCEDREWKERVLEPLGKSPRQIMQTLGTEWGRNLVHKDLWVILLGGTITYFDPHVIGDVRFANEAAWVRRTGGQVWHISRANLPPVSSHTSEAGVNACEGDKYIFNDTDFDDLYHQVEVCLKNTS